MSGSGRKSHYRKSVQEDFLHGFPLPEENDCICRAISSRGTNIFEIELRNGTVELAILPNKFKKLIWLKRGDYLIASTSTQDPNIVDSGKIKHLHDLGLWYWTTFSLLSLTCSLLLVFAVTGRPEEFVLESKKENDYGGMPSDEDEDYEDEDGEEDNIKVDSMGNTIENQEDENEEQGEGVS